MLKYKIILAIEMIIFLYVLYKQVTSTLKAIEKLISTQKELKNSKEKREEWNRGPLLTRMKRNSRELRPLTNIAIAWTFALIAALIAIKIAHSAIRF